MGNTKNNKTKKTLNIHSQKRESNIVIVVLDCLKQRYYILKTNANIVVLINFSIRNIIFVSLFHFVKHYLMHRLLFFIRAVCLPTSIVCRNVGVGNENCSTHTRVFL